MKSSGAITGLADTALWVAAMRAEETARADAIFNDELAFELAGERGRRIARNFPQSSVVSWGLVIRTSAIDRLIAVALADRVDTVVNLGAGFDTRPYRLSLPATTRWVEIDFPTIVKAKEAALAGREPRCRVERIGLDLLDQSGRDALLRSLDATARGMLVLAEGVIPYFSNSDVAALARDLAGLASVRHWILDFDNAGVRSLPKSWANRLRAAPVRFRVDDWFEFFESCGWRTRQLVSSAEESERRGRPYPAGGRRGLVMRLLPAKMRRRILSTSGAVLLERTDS